MHAVVPCLASRPCCTSEECGNWPCMHAAGPHLAVAPPSSHSCRRRRPVPLVSPRSRAARAWFTTGSEPPSPASAFRGGLCCLWVQKQCCAAILKFLLIAAQNATVGKKLASCCRGRAAEGRGALCGTISLCGVPSTAACERSSRQLAAFMCLAMCRPTSATARGVCVARGHACCGTGWVVARTRSRCDMRAGSAGRARDSPHAAGEARSPLTSQPSCGS